MAAASLTLSILAFLTSLAALGWTIYSWQRSGARLKVNCTSLILFGGMRPSQTLIAVEVTNSGRTATTVSAIGFKSTAFKGVLAMSEPAAGPNPIPARLEAGESCTYPVDPDELLRTCQEKNFDHRTVKPYANSGHGIFEGAIAQVAMDILDRRA